MARERSRKLKHFRVSGALPSSIFTGANLPVLEGSVLSGDNIQLNDAASGGSAVGAPIQTQQFNSFVREAGVEPIVTEEFDGGLSFEEQSVAIGSMHRQVTATFVVEETADADDPYARLIADMER